MKVPSYLLALVAVFLVVVHGDESFEPFTETDYQLTFSEWKKTYGISYADSNAENTAYAAFKQNVDDIVANDSDLIELDLNEFSGISSKTFIENHTGAKNPGLIAAVTAAVVALSIAAIIGIAVGCFVCVGVTGGVVAGTVVYVQNKKEEENDIELKKPRFGVDLLGPKETPFSITARSAPQDWS